VEPITYSILTTVLASFLLAEALVLTAGRHGRFTMDAPGAIQKFHSKPTPRIGGVGIYLALLIASRLMPDPDSREILNTILLAGMPALLVGLAEDVTKQVGVVARLLATMASGVAACWVSGVWLTHVDLPVIDTWMRLAPIAVLVTAFGVAGVANSINIIDGFHGLASGTTTIALIAIAILAGLSGDTPLVLTAVILAASVAGFWMVNFPWGKLFLGDGGAYFAGFALAWLAVLLPVRNPEISPWASFLVCGYPIIEVIYSMVRRRLRNQSPGTADRRHMHSLVATRIVQRKLPRLNPTLQNAAVSVIMWLFAVIPAAAAIAFYTRTDLLLVCVAGCIAAYHVIYRRITRHEQRS
jgi:UDP-N-acetylmuramyl pentapeptide phosphotransferase/UDP-N-acetylglucosamine-1-phosphate transferase